MSFTITSIISYVTWVGIHVGLPFCLIVLPILWHRPDIIPQRSWKRSLLVTILLLWPLMIGARLAIEIPLSEARRPDGDPDRFIAGNVALLMFGWLYALILCVPHLLLRAFHFIFFRRHHTSAPAGTLTNS